MSDDKVTIQTRVIPCTYWLIVSRNNVHVHARQLWSVYQIIANLITLESPPLDTRTGSSHNFTLDRWSNLPSHPSIPAGRARVHRGFPTLGQTLVGAVSSGLFANANRNQRYNTRERYGAPTDPNRRCRLETCSDTNFVQLIPKMSLTAIITFSYMITN